MTPSYRTFVAGIAAGWLVAANVAADILMIPDSGNDKVWAFDPLDGSPLSENFIPNDGTLMQPISAVYSGIGTVYISDENADAVFEYDGNGTLLRTVASRLDALQGLTVYNGSLYVGSRTAAVIYRITVDGTVTTWANEAAVGTPRDIAFRAVDALVTNSLAENLERFDTAGSFLDTFHDSDGVTGVDFPQQIQILATGQVLVAGFSPPRGLYLYDNSGNQVAEYTNLITSPRGVYRLDNGRYLYAGGTRVMSYDPVTQTEITIVNRSGASFRHIDRAPFVVAPPDTDGDGVPDLQDNCLDVLNANQIDSNGDGYGNACDADLNDDCIVNVLDLGILRTVFFSDDADADFDGDGVVNVSDLGAMRLMFFMPPGPSGTTDACAS